MSIPDAEEISHYLHVEWTSADEAALGAWRGDAGSQAIWEAYALLIAVNTWRDALVQMYGTIELRGDAQGVLQAVLARRARCPAVNLVVAEVQLVLGASMHDVFAAHVWSEDNDVADDLSRLAEGAALPPACRLAQKWPAARSALRFVGKTPPWSEDAL